MTLPDAFLRRPIAHRALHDLRAKRAENSLAAIKAAVSAGYGIEIDLQLSADGEAMVFHDDTLKRLTGYKGPVRAQTRATLESYPLKGGGGTIPALDTVLAEIAGRVPLLIEIKDQDGLMGPNVGVLERAAVKALQSYQGDVALMSFNPHSVAVCAEIAPHIPRGITTARFKSRSWPTVPKITRQSLRDIPDYDRVGACFISHQASNLKAARVAELKAQGAKILTWTIKSPQAEAAARQIADNITFEGYLA